jgi:hypothetical protein
MILRSLIFALLLLTGSVFAAPSAKLWPVWQAHDESNQQALDHQPWDELLGRYLQVNKGEINRFDYRAMTAADRAQLKGYLQGLQQATVSKLSRAAQRAYWINLYNATTVAVVLEHYPVESILDIDISPGLFSNGPWGKKLLKIEGQEVSLDDIEHRILRPIWRDPRLHYALNCASLGCPNLQPVAFTRENSERLLDAAAQAFINHPRGAEVVDGKLVVSSIYDWFEADFGGSDAGVIKYLRRYAQPPLKEALRGVEEVDDHQYEWGSTRCVSSDHGRGPSFPCSSPSRRRYCCSQGSLWWPCPVRPTG